MTTHPTATAVHQPEKQKPARELPIIFSTPMVQAILAGRLPLGGNARCAVRRGLDVFLAIASAVEAGHQ